MKQEQKIPFMAKVRDKVTGLEGKVTAFLVYKNGCRQYEIMFLGKDKDERKRCWLDEENVELLSEPSEKPAANKGNPGGPSRGPAPRTGPSPRRGHSTH